MYNAYTLDLINNSPFSSIKEAADYFKVNYRTNSRHLDTKLATMQDKMLVYFFKKERSVEVLIFFAVCFNLNVYNMLYKKWYQVFLSNNIFKFFHKRTLIFILPLKANEMSTAVCNIFSFMEAPVEDNHSFCFCGIFSSIFNFHFHQYGSVVFPQTHLRKDALQSMSLH